MNAAKVTLTATILAAALGLALGLATAPAMADKPDFRGDHGDHDSGTGSDATIYDVSLEFLLVPSTGFEVGPCLGDTDILANPGLIVNFDAGCFVVITTDRAPPDDEVDMYLFRLEAKTKGSGVTELVFAFSDLEDFMSGSNLWQTDRITLLVEEAGEGVLILTPPDRFSGDGEILTKGHQPDKGAETIGGVLIGPLTYTPR